MYINFSEIVKKWGAPNGIIHIGAHLLEEREEYLKHNLVNTIWVEANPNIYQQILNLDLNKEEKVFNHCITDKDDQEYSFNITNNGQSSSILDLDKHSEYHPHIFVTETISVNSKRMDTLLNQNNIDVSEYDFLNLDIQGAELLAIKSFGNLIENFKFIYTEVNTNYLYKDNALISEIDDYLRKYNFVRVETVLTDAEWGDALYIKEDMIPKLIFDIGGHVGLFTDECLKNYPNAKIVIIEANENLYKNLQEKYSGNSKVVVLNYLVSDKTADIKGFYTCESDQISTASEDWVKNSRFSDFNYRLTTGVVTVNLDSLIKIFGKPDLVKIDVEGYELEVVNGLTQKVGEICFEWAEEQYDKINQTCSQLKEIGYTQFGYVIGDEYLLKPSDYTSWEDSSIHQLIDITRKSEWGMIWTK